MIIGLMGYAQTGKDTVGQLLVEKHDYHRRAFADVLRECLYALNPAVPVAYSSLALLGSCDAYRLQDLVDRHGWDHCKTHYEEVRSLLQRLGTEVGREILGQGIWVNTAMSKLSPEVYDYVFTDVRFPNECAAIKEAGGILVRVKRPDTKPVNAHPSETATNHIDADYTINNDGTIKDLRKHVLHILFEESKK